VSRSIFYITSHYHSNYYVLTLYSILFGVTFTIYTINLFRHRSAQSEQNNGVAAVDGTHAYPNQMEKGAVA
jgi:hypothetical protein